MGKINGCRMCGGADIEMFLDLGEHALMNSLIKKEDLDLQQEKFPLQAGYCRGCHLVQLMYIVDAKKIYQDIDYLFYSSDMPTLPEYFAAYARELGEKYLRDGDLVVEIGSNDGVLLGQFPKSIRVLGADPAINVALRALHRGIPTVSAFFDKVLSRRIAAEWGKARVLTGSNCIAHLEDLHSLMDGVKILLDEEGVFCVEANYWGGMVRNINYSLIYLDHFSFFSLEVWQKFANEFGMKVFDAYITPAQGGSLRIFVCRDDRPETARLKELENEERRSRLNTFAVCQEYAGNVNRRRKEIREFLQGLKQKGKTIAGYGAAAKGLSILKSSDIGKETISYFVDDSPAKQGLFTPETHIPVYRRGMVRDPDYFMILAPNYAEVIMAKEKEFVRKGGRFIIPKKNIEVYPSA